jgi:hypothetical protein
VSLDIVLRACYTIDDSVLPFSLNLLYWASTDEQPKRPTTLMDQNRGNSTIISSQGSCLIPHPWTTYAEGAQMKIKCMIYQDSDLIIRSQESLVYDTTRSILPCSHVFGTLCLKLWLKESHKCPFCQ